MAGRKSSTFQLTIFFTRLLVLFPFCVLSFVTPFLFSFFLKQLHLFLTQYDFRLSPPKIYLIGEAYFLDIYKLQSKVK